MYKFLSYDFIKAYKDQWNKNEKLKDDLKNFSANLKYYIISKENEAVELIIKNGEAISCGMANGKDYDFEMWATLEDWKSLATGQMGPKAAMLTKKLRFKGSMITAMKYMGAFEESLRMMGSLPVDWNA